MAPSSALWVPTLLKSMDLQCGQCVEKRPIVARIMTLYPLSLEHCP